MSDIADARRRHAGVWTWRRWPEICWLRIGKGTGTLVLPVPVSEQDVEPAEESNVRSGGVSPGGCTEPVISWTPRPGCA